MPKLFFTDCTITNLNRVNHQSDAFYALIDGRVVQNLVMDNAVYHHLINPRENKIKRLWLYKPHFRKSLIIVAAGSTSNTHKTIRNNSLTNFRRLILQPLLLSLLSWFFAWILLTVPIFFIYDTNISAGWNILETLAAGTGAAAGTLSCIYSCWLFVNMARLENWQPGLITADAKGEH
jgi:hypothetical protein